MFRSRSDGFESARVASLIVPNLVRIQACMQESKRLLATLEQELRIRQSVRPRPMKFETGRMRTEDENAIKPVGYIVQLG